MRTANAQIFYTEGSAFTGPQNDYCDANCTTQKAKSAMWSDFVPGIFNCKIDYENSNNAS